MSTVWQKHSKPEPDWLDSHEDEQDQLSRFGAFKPITWIAAVVVGCTAAYWTCVGLLWIGLRLSR